MIRADKCACALRPTRLINDEIRLYTATTFPQNPQAGCDMWLRRLSGQIVEQSDFVLDVLNADGDIVQEICITKAGFEYLRRSLHFRRELTPRREQCQPG